MKLFGVLGVMAAVATAGVTVVGAAEIQLSGLTGNARAEKLNLYGRGRLAGSPFVINAAPAVLTGKTIVSVPRGDGTRAGAAYSVSVDQPANVYLLVQDRGKPNVPEGWQKVPGGMVRWADNFTDSIYFKKLEGPGKVDVPAHDGVQGGNFGIPNALVITDGSEDPASLGVTESRMMPKNRMRNVRQNFIFVEFPAFLKGLPLMSVPRGRFNAPGAGYSFTLKKPATVYLLVQDRGKPDIPEGWKAEEGKAVWRLGNVRHSDLIYSREFPAGTVEIPAHNGKQGTSYGVPHAAVIRYH